MEDIDALALLKEELETEEVHLKVNAIHRLKTVIMCIGVDDTIKKLIPYLESKNQSRLNHVQVSLRRKMMKFCSLSRKSSARFGKNLQTYTFRELLPDKTTFLTLLESLARVDETVVREQVSSSYLIIVIYQATKSLTNISKVLTDAEIQNKFVPMVIKLASGEWFTGRVSSCSLFFPAYSRSGPQKEKLRKMRLYQ